MSGAGASTVTAWVALLVNGTYNGLVELDISGAAQSVDRVRALVKNACHEDLVGISRAHIQLFLSSKAGVKVSPPERIGDALAPDETLLPEVLSRLNPTGAGAGASFPDPLYLLAVAEGA